MFRLAKIVLVVFTLFLVGCSLTSTKGYIGNKKSHVFHRVDCKWAQKISSKNAVMIDSRKKAINVYRMRPCKSCKP